MIWLIDHSYTQGQLVKQGQSSTTIQSSQESIGEQVGQWWSCRGKVENNFQINNLALKEFPKNSWDKTSPFLKISNGVWKPFTKCQ
jgi:hypothetical protein